MEINWPALIVVSIGAIVLIIFLVKKNYKDEKKYEQDLNYFEKKDESETNDKDDGL